VNDQSNADSLLQARTIAAQDQRFRLLHVPDAPHAPGPWLARNVGIAATQTAFVAFLDADDLWHPDKLRRQLVLHHDDGAELSVTGYHRFRRGASGWQVMHTRIPPAQMDLERLLRGNLIPLSSAIVSTDLLRQEIGRNEEAVSGPFRPEHHEDYGLWLRLFARHSQLRYGCLPEPLMAYRLHADSISAQRWRSHRAVSRLLAQHCRHRLHHGLLIGRWAAARLAVQLVETQAGRRQGPLPKAYNDLLEPSHGADFTLTQGGGPPQRANQGRGLDSPNPKAHA
jgi:teichuronic acid biosynthesis glycosyltransferase TuaG